ncbi:hypothetical protein VB773_13935 [Haloarculaceae archaeon H-GB2-1]|nr:hypothetical protein [Haloarculaceae archaeon H-GB1-1]MEA5408560.1 hypothetical protein [Haloarculaceae archaeon H-GB2-1]
MSTETWQSVAGARTRTKGWMNLLGRIVFGDRVGVAIFLAGIWFSLLSWRVGFAVNDTNTIANTLVALTDGHLYLVDVPFGSPLNPGSHFVDGRLYGRNYGQVAASVPLLWILRGVHSVVPLYLFFSALWSLSAFGISVQVGHVLDRRRVGRIVGALVATALLGLNLQARALEISADRLPIAALQLGSILAAAFVGVFGYRLLVAEQDRTVAAITGLVLALASPVAFWATIPKRHAFSALAVVVVLYTFDRSRRADGDDLLGPTGFRALAYATVGLATWVHAAEGFVLFVGLALVDLPTARRNDPRTLAVVGGAFLVSLLPFLLTNFAISGSPFEPPRLLPDYNGEPITGVEPTESASGNGGSSQATAAGGDGGPPEPNASAELATGGGSTFPDMKSVSESVLSRPRFYVKWLFLRGFTDALNRPDGLYRVLVHRGNMGDDAGIFFPAGTNLSVLESMPLLAALVSIPATLVREVRRRTGLLRSLRATDVLAALYAVFFFTLVFPNLPIHFQVTVRYLTPLYPLGVYAVARQETVVRTLRDYRSVFASTAVATVLLGVPAIGYWTAYQGLGKGGAFQFHGLLALAAAGLLAAATVASVYDARADRATAALLGVSVGLGTALLLLSAVVYMHYSNAALPIVREVGGAVRFFLVRTTLG